MPDEALSARVALAVWHQVLHQFVHHRHDDVEVRGGGEPHALGRRDHLGLGHRFVSFNWCLEISIHSDGNELVADIHDRMPVILAPTDYARWLGEEPDPSDLMRSYPAELMRIWPISTRVNKPENDDPAILEPVELAASA